MPVSWLRRFGPALGIRSKSRLILAGSGFIVLIVVVVGSFWVSKPANDLSPAPAARGASPPVSSTTPAVLSPTEVFRRVSPSVFVVEVTDQDRLIARGSAVAVADGLLITNKHVVARGRPWLKHGKNVYAPQIYRLHPSQDLALLAIEDLDAPPVSFETNVSVGDRVYAIGAPKGLELTFSEGLISSIRESEDGRIIQTTAAISSGSSGGGLFDEHGKLVGITTGGFKGGQNLNFALPSELVIAFAGELRPTAAKSNSPPAVGLPRRSLRNGTNILEPSGPQGYSELTVENGTSYDTTVKLVHGNEVRRWVYIKAKSEVTVEAIGPCSCRVLWASGVDWDNAHLRFTRERSFSTFENALVFSENRVGGKIEYTERRITLHPVPEGRARTRLIDEKEFESAKIH